VVEPKDSRQVDYFITYAMCDRHPQAIEEIFGLKLPPPARLEWTQVRTA